ncbi:MAG: DNA polymerase III subunit delta [Treponema sp. GWB1_62_6]|nr:MAG: DNA polymerase III subunit delta [Treponema sp. GWB1_62_6]OHE64094.1 MAG: DNA polymerase III subunit delta [Treponema sp. GWC1_61_84]OHE67144.1 MAG: DNA polymerase III subunit delta [Treponema sp. GWA1_62_8]HCM26914.1 DNA polymerase III subunit delta [Treponema sp.]
MAKGSCRLYLGPEIGERRDAVDALRASLAKDAGAPPEEHSFYAGEQSIGDLVSLLRNASLFSETRLVLLKNAELVRKKEDVELLVSYMTAPADDTTLALLSDETSVDKRIDGTVSKDAKKIFWELFENRKTDWVGAFFKREGFRIDADGIEAVLELVENNTDALRRECGKLTLFLEKGSLVGAAEVEACLSHTREESAFTLFSRIAEGDLAKALETVRKLLAAKEAPVAVLAGLAWCFRRLADYLELADAGRLNDFELRKAGLASKKAQRDYAAAARRYDAGSARRSLALLAEFDIALRSSGSALEDLLMDLFIYKVVAGAARPLETMKFPTLYI